MLDKLKQNIGRWGITGLILVSCLCGCISYIKNRPEETDKNSVILTVIMQMTTRQMEKSYFMLSDFMEYGVNQGNFIEIVSQAMLQTIPFYYYGEYEVQDVAQNEDSSMAERIVNREGADEDIKNIEESKLDYGQDALHIEQSMLEEMKKENGKPLTDLTEEVNPDANRDANKESSQEQSGTDMEFAVAQYPAYTYDWSEEWNYDSLVSNFYAVDNTTELKKEYVNLDKLLYQDLSVDKTMDEPQILIYHTHSQEGFADSVKGAASDTVVGAGDKLAGLLRDKYGFKVMHHTGEYDVESREHAYSNSLPAIEKVLKENPSIEVVIDLHRDEMKAGKKLVMDLQGRPTARFMFFDGMSYIRKKGDIDYLENPYIQENLAFSFQTQVAANEYYPGLARKIYLKAYRYNLHLKAKSMLIELGAQTNTVEEIMNACDPLAHIIAIVLDERL